MSVAADDVADSHSYVSFIDLDEADDVAVVAAVVVADVDLDVSGAVLLGGHGMV